MVRQDNEMFKLHPESLCRDDPAVADMRARNYWVGDDPKLPDDFPSPQRHPDTYPCPGLTIPQYPIPLGVAPVNASLDAKLDIIIDLLSEIKRMLK